MLRSFARVARYPVLPGIDREFAKRNLFEQLDFPGEAVGSIRRIQAGCATVFVMDHGDPGHPET
jgi:hypothetical protein